MKRNAKYLVSLFNANTEKLCSSNVYTEEEIQGNFKIESLPKKANQTKTFDLNFVTPDDMENVIQWRYVVTKLYF